MPAWYAAGLGHVWLPYAQMKTASPPLAVRATQGSRIVLADGRELIDGIASWWTACHGYNHPHIRAAVEAPACGNAARHVRRHGARAGADAGAAARGDARQRSRPRVLQRFRLGRGRSRAENGGAVLAQSRRARAHPHCRLQRRLSRRHHRRDGGLRSGGQLARGVSRPVAAADRGRSAGRRRERRRTRNAAGASRRGDRRDHRRAAGAGRRRHALSRCTRAAKPCARSPTVTSCC